MTTQSIEPIDPGVIRPLPVTPPSLSDPANFDARGDAVIGHIPTLISDMNSVAVKTKQNADAAHEIAIDAKNVTAANKTAAQNAQSAAELAAANAAGSAAFYGRWSELTGPLDMPATVTHDDKDWRLVRNLIDVTAAEPGISDAWEEVKASLIRQTRTANVELDASAHGQLIDIVSGTFTQTFAATATLGDGWWCYLKNSGSGDITLDPNASELIDGLTSYIMYPGEVRLVQCDGTALRSVVLNAFYKVFTTSGSFSKPPGYIGFEVEVIGGGQGGAAGKSGHQQGGLSGTVNGAAGGVPGARRQAFVPSSRIAASITVTVGAGGLGGTTQSTSGGAGGASIFGYTALLSSGSSGVPELTGIVGAGSIGGTGGSISYTYSVANPSAGAPGAYIGSGVTIPSGGASETYGYIPNIAGTYSATGTAGQAATADFCSGAGGGTATCRMEGNNTYPSDVIVKLTAGKGGNGGIGAGGGGGGHALAIWGNGGGLSGSPTFNLTHGIGGNGGPGLVSVWGVI